MPKTIQRFIATFTAIDEVVSLEIPRESEEVALRVLESETAPQIVIVVIVDESLVVGTYQRNFQMIAETEPLPETFKKYIASLPFGPLKNLVHLVEV